MHAKIGRIQKLPIVFLITRSLGFESYRQDCEKNVKMNFCLWANRGFLGKINCIFTITSKDSGHYCTVQVPVS